MGSRARKVEGRVGCRQGTAFAMICCCRKVTIELTGLVLKCYLKHFLRYVELAPRPARLTFLPRNISILHGQEQQHPYHHILCFLYKAEIYSYALLLFFDHTRGQLRMVALEMASIAGTCHWVSTAPDGIDAANVALPFHPKCLPR